MHRYQRLTHLYTQESLQSTKLKAILYAENIAQTYVARMVVGSNVFCLVDLEGSDLLLNLKGNEEQYMGKFGGKNKCRNVLITL